MSLRSESAATTTTRSASNSTIDTRPASNSTIGTRFASSAAWRIGLAAVASFAVAALGFITWGPLLAINLSTSPGIPWSVPVEAILLLLIWRKLAGRGWPRRAAAARAALLRPRAVPPRVFTWALIAGALSLVALAGLWIVLVQLTGAGGNPTLPSSAAYPAITIAAAIIMGSLVSPITEESAFRGYGQVLLERRFAPATAVLLSSLFFALYHGPTQGFAPTKLLFYFTVGVVFGAIACLTRSVLPALPIHIAGDLLFFTAIWPHDAARVLVWHGGADLAFWLRVGQVVVFTVLAAFAFRRLHQACSRSLDSGGAVDLSLPSGAAGIAGGTASEVVLLPMGG
ncbi:MAG TPA: CPBP family intramembrane glutamic endopeptidase [Candidatus Binatia bacterium]|nr:CPBP family intramembrane glutamic endopeptidase [Candidatus Binatia bacterium]